MKNIYFGLVLSNLFVTVIAFVYSGLNLLSSIQYRNADNQLLISYGTDLANLNIISEIYGQISYVFLLIGLFCFTQFFILLRMEIKPNSKSATVEKP